MDKPKGRVYINDLSLAFLPQDEVVSLDVQWPTDLTPTRPCENGQQ
ncbi:TPA: hypothetical protein O3H02_004311 [Salmonella enterica subsp. enterica serovar Saintpaul str. CFSAN004144]|nr:hypothetical protein [Salmonella enterica subsp. enterica serovar Saintpaul str. CFSAN004144]